MVAERNSQSFRGHEFTKTVKRDMKAETVKTSTPALAFHKTSHLIRICCSRPKSYNPHTKSLLQDDSLYFRPPVSPACKKGTNLLGEPVHCHLFALCILNCDTVTEHVNCKIVYASLIKSKHLAHLNRKHPNVYQFFNQLFFSRTSSSQSCLTTHLRGYMGPRKPRSY